MNKMEKMLGNLSAEFVKIQLHVYDEYYEIGKIELKDCPISNQTNILCKGIAQNNDFIYEFVVNLSDDELQLNYEPINPSNNNTLTKSELKVYKHKYIKNNSFFRDIKARYLYLYRLRNEWNNITPYRKDIPDHLEERVLNIFLKYERLKFFWMKSLK